MLTVVEGRLSTREPVECLALGYPGIDLNANFNNAASKDQEPANSRTCSTVDADFYPSTKAQHGLTTRGGVVYRTGVPR